MNRPAKRIDICSHAWWMILRPGGEVALFCQLCEKTDQDVFSESIARLISMEIDTVNIWSGYHDYDGTTDAFIPVNLYVTQSMSYNVQDQAFGQRASVTVTPRGISQDPNILDGQVLDSTIEEIEENTETLLAAIDRQDQSRVDDAPHGTGWCAPSP